MQREDEKMHCGGTIVIFVVDEEWRVELASRLTASSCPETVQVHFCEFSNLFSLKRSSLGNFLKANLLLGLRRSDLLRLRLLGLRKSSFFSGTFSHAIGPISFRPIRRESLTFFDHASLRRPNWKWANLMTSTAWTMTMASRQLRLTR